jgi:hypothetical protein
MAASQLSLPFCYSERFEPIPELDAAGQPVERALPRAIPHPPRPAAQTTRQARRGRQ